MASSGSGSATEAARRLVRCAFEDLGFAHIDASTDAANTASIRVLAKLGIPEIRREVVDGLDTRFFRLSLDARERTALPGPRP